MANKYQILVENMQNSSNKDFPQIKDIKFALYDIFKRKDFKEMGGLVQILSKFYFKFYDYQEELQANFEARRDLDIYSSDVDNFFEENGEVQDFYRKAVNYFYEEDVRLN